MHLVRTGLEVPHAADEPRVRRSAQQSFYLHAVMLRASGAWLAGSFGVLTAWLATIGAYGVISYLVVRRRHENRYSVGARLGADTSRPFHFQRNRHFVGRRPSAPRSTRCRDRIGASSLLSNLSPRDPMTLAAAAGVLATIGFLATSLPASERHV